MTTQHLDNERYRTENAHQEAHFLFRSGSRSLRGQGVFSRISRAAGSGGVTSSAFLAEVGAALARAREAGIDDPIVMGAIPFDTTSHPACTFRANAPGWRSRAKAPPRAQAYARTCWPSAASPMRQASRPP